jgi:hypothetical protein
VGHEHGGWTSVTLAWGRNRELGGKYDEYLGEATRQYRSRTIFSRVEWTQVETDLLRTGVHTFQGGRKNGHVVLPGARDFVGSLTAGATQTVWRPRGWDVAVGAEVTENVVPPNLSPFYGAHPWSGQIFLRTRPPAMHRMTDVIMTRHGQ